MPTTSWTTAFLRMSFVLIFSLAACGKGFKEDEQKQYEEDPGQYKARLVSLNLKAGRYTGWASLTIADNQFWARVKVEGPANEIPHAQYVHVNGRCPDMADDTNGDGYLDFAEVIQVAGPILLPLDGNLNSQQKGLHEFPFIKKNKRYYYYSEAAITERLMNDLRAPDVIRDDMITKLRSGEGLNMHRRVLIIYGVSDTHRLPSSIRSFEGYPEHLSLPIACGEFSEGRSDAFGWEEVY